MWQRFTERTRRVIFFAQEEAAQRGENFVGAEHILLGLVREDDSVAARLLERMGLNLTRIRQEVERQITRGEARLGQEMQMTPRGKRVIDLAYEEARQLNNNYIGTEHLLLGLVREAEGIAGRVLNRLGADLERTRREVMALQDGDGVMTPSKKKAKTAASPSSEIADQNERGSGWLRPTIGEKSVKIAAHRIVQIALQEDLTPNDLTSELTVPENAQSRAVAIAKAEGVIAGIEAARQAFAQVDTMVQFYQRVEDGTPVAVGDAIFTLSGPSRSILAAERTALNLIQHLSGVATETARYVEAVEGTNATIIDTRKTTPGMRLLEKYAVRMGGGKNHRFNLSDGILIKDNHIVAAGGIRAAIERVKAEAPHTLRIEVEVTNEAEIDEALEAGADALLLDNMSPEEMKAAVLRVDGRALTEASGRITLENVRAAAESGVDFISVGALTHSTKALDISLKFNDLDGGGSS
jgi:nicotinate-nucleotide pyrophosphorylase (carboxylating)